MSAITVVDRLWSINKYRKLKSKLKTAMKYPTYILSIFLIVLITGCNCYYGYRDYEETRPVKKNGESVILEEYRIEKKDDNIILRRFRRYGYTQVYRKYAVNEKLYNNFNWGKLIPHILSYPFTLVFSPLVLLGDNSSSYAAGFAYVYTNGRKFWNWINPLINVTDDDKEYKITVSSHRDVEEFEYRDENCVVDGVEINIILGDGRRLNCSAGISLSQLRKKVFEYPLPERKEMVGITFKDARIDLEIVSHDLPKKQLDDWSRITHASAAEALSNEEEYLGSLRRFFEEKKISQDTFDIQCRRLKDLADAERKRIAAEEAKQLQKAKDTYDKLVDVFDKVAAFSKKEKLTDVEYDKLFECSKKLLDCEECEAAIGLLNRKGVISDDIAQARMKCLQDARTSIMYPCGNVYRSNIVLYGDVKSGISEYYLQRQRYAPDFFFTEVRGYRVAYGCRYEVNSEQGIEELKNEFRLKFPDLHINDKSRENEVSEDWMSEWQLRGGGFITFEASFMSYDITLENDDVFITITGNKIKTNVGAAFLRSDPDNDYKLQRIKSVFKSRIHGALSSKGITDRVCVAIVDKKLKKHVTSVPKICGIKNLNSK